MIIDTSNIIDALDVKASNCKILVVGDIMLDQYLYGTVTRISPEAPVPVNVIKRQENKLGGSANVVHNLARLGCEVYISGLIGRDGYGDLIRKQLAKLNVNTNALLGIGTQTTTKIRVLGGQQQLVRLDFEKAEKLTEELEIKIKNGIISVLDQGINAVIISDYGKGVCTESLCKDIINLAKSRNIQVFIDPKGSNWDKYKEADYITPNVKELGDVCKQTIVNNDVDVETNAKVILNKYSLTNLLVTRSEQGMTLVNHDEIITLPTQALEVYDVSGAGDTVISTFCLGITCGLTHNEALYLSNLAAGIEVGKLGTYAVSREEIIDKLV